MALLTVSSVFPFWWVSVTASIAGVLGLLLLRWRFKAIPLREAILMAALVSVSVMVWRLSGNIPVLNDDPIGGLSPNDFICPVVSYVFLSLYLDLRQPPETKSRFRARAWLVIIVFLANVFTI
jgi:hypothetical protein